ncbi:unnamed protein product, partial [Rotaria sordida]
KIPPNSANGAGDAGASPGSIVINRNGPGDIIGALANNPPFTPGTFVTVPASFPTGYSNVAARFPVNNVCGGSGFIC